MLDLFTVTKSQCLTYYHSCEKPFSLFSKLTDQIFILLDLHVMDSINNIFIQYYVFCTIVLSNINKIQEGYMFLSI